MTTFKCQFDKWSILYRLNNLQYNVVFLHFGSGIHIRELVDIVRVVQILSNAFPAFLAELLFALSSSGASSSSMMLAI